MPTTNLKMKVGIVENSGPNTLQAFLQNSGNGAVSLDIASAFITLSGIDSVLYVLKKIARKGSVRILTGLYQGFTDPDALRKLYRIQEETKGRLSVSISKDNHFHWKCYFIKRDKSARLVVGSSNMTGDGLRQTGEFNLVLTVPTDSKPFLDTTNLFESHWTKKSKPLTDVILMKYEDWRKTVGFNHQKVSVPTRKILGGNNTSYQSKKSGKMDFWQIGISGYCSKETVKILNDTTNWDSKGLAYFSTWNSRFNEGDRVVLFDLIGNHVRIVEIKETTETPDKTPDGIFFAAYKENPTFPKRKLIRARWKFLKESQLIKRQSDAQTTRKLSKNKFEAFVENLKRTIPK